MTKLSDLDYFHSGCHANLQIVKKFLKLLQILTITFNNNIIIINNY